MNKKDLRAGIVSTMDSVKQNATRVLSFFGIDGAKYFLETEAV
jgi:hypothetical protein